MSKPKNWKDIAGQKFGKLTSTQYLGDCVWECVCLCGSTVKVNGTKLRLGRKKSCGCYRHEFQKTMDLSRIKKHGMHRSLEYSIWSAMRARCSNPNNPQWENYGGRGVRVCEEWAKFENFIRDMGPRPSRKHSLDRTDNGLLYSKATCRWATGIEQLNNTRRNRRVTYQGRTRTVAEWARMFGVKYSTFIGRVRLGWNVEEAVRGRLG